MASSPVAAGAGVDRIRREGPDRRGRRRRAVLFPHDPGRHPGAATGSRGVIADCGRADILHAAFGRPCVGKFFWRRRG